MRRRFIHRALNALPGVSCVDPAGAFYAFPNITGTGIASKTLEVELLDKAGVATIAGTSFGRHGEGFLRLSYANSLDNIKAAVDRLAGYLAEREAVRSAGLVCVSSEERRVGTEWGRTCRSRG